MRTCFFAGFGLIPILLLAEDWPQWRGLHHNGSINQSPALAETWPEKGPAKNWESETISAGWDGGWGSPSVAAGMAYLYCHEKTKKPVAALKLSPDTIPLWKNEKAQAEKILAKLAEGEQEKFASARRRLEWVEKELAPLDKTLAEQIKKALAGAAPDPIKDDKDTKTEGDEEDEELEDDKPLPVDPAKLMNESKERAKQAKEVAEKVLAALESVQEKAFAEEKELIAWLDEALAGVEKPVRDQINARFPRTEDVFHDVVICVDAGDGRTVWKQRFPGTKTGAPASSTPCIAGGKCYVPGSNSNVYCFDAKTGEVAWQAKTKAPAGTDCSASMAVTDGVAIAAAGPVVGFDAQTGELLWQAKVQCRYGSPVLWNHQGRTYWVVRGDNETVCLEPKTGKDLWRLASGGVSTPAIEGDRMVILGASRGQGLTAYDLTLEAATERWKFQTVADRGASPAIYRGHVFAQGGENNGRFICVELETGKLKWEQAPSVNSNYSSLVVVDEKIIHVAGAWVLLLKASPEGYAELSKAALGTVECTSPAVADGRLFVRATKGLACFDLRKDVQRQEGQ